MSDDNLQQDENASQTGEEMSTADAVSLFTTSLNSALAKQKQDISSELQPNRQSSTSTCKESSINSVPTMAVCNFEYFVALAKSVKFRINQCSGIVKLALRNQRRNTFQAVNPLRIKIELYFGTFLLKLELARLPKFERI
jgi:hypothetical protein